MATMNQEEREFVARLFEAAFQGNGGKVKELVADYSKLHKISPAQVLSKLRDPQGRTVLHFACHSNPKESSKEEDIVSLLLDWLPSENEATKLLSQKDEEGLTPLHFAAQNNNAALAESRVDTILSIGGDKLSLIQSNVGATALHYASTSNDTLPATLVRLCKAGPEALSLNSNQGGTPLHWAAAVEPSINHLTIIKTLVQECGANVNFPNKQGLPAHIMAAAARNDVHCAFLIRNGADVSIELPGNISLFHMAADLNLTDTMKALMEVCDSTKIQDYCQRKTSTGETPLDVALQEGNLECVMILSASEDRAASQAMIDERQKSNAPAKSHVEEASAASRTTTTEPPAESTEEERQVMEIMSKISKVSISDDEIIQQALELKQQGNEHFQKKEWQEALECYSKAIELNPTDATFYSNRSACYMELNLPEDALKDALVARQLRPDWSKACYRMAVARLRLGRYQDAAVAAFEGLKYDEDNEELQQLLRVAVKKGKEEYKASTKQEETKKNANKGVATS